MLLNCLTHFLVGAYNLQWNKEQTSKCKDHIEFSEIKPREDQPPDRVSRKAFRMCFRLRGKGQTGTSHGDAGGLVLDWQTQTMNSIVWLRMACFVGAQNDIKK